MKMIYRTSIVKKRIFQDSTLNRICRISNLRLETTPEEIRAHLEFPLMLNITARMLRTAARKKWPT